MSERVIYKPLWVSLARLRDLDDTLGENFTCRCSLAIRRKGAPRFLDRVPCRVEGRRQKRDRVRVEGCI